MPRPSGCGDGTTRPRSPGSTCRARNITDRGSKRPPGRGGLIPDLEFDDAVVGAGVIGLATAYHLARRGSRVIAFDLSSRALGASVRNFGMLWPIGQPAGPDRTPALRSLEIWSGVLRDARLWHDPCGSLHLAY